jgi:hypothetical protein
LCLPLRRKTRSRRLPALLFANNMKPSVLALLCLVFSACSDSAPPKSIPKSYAATFAVALLPDSLLIQYGGTFSQEKGYSFSSLDDRYKLAAYVLENMNRFPVCRQDGGWIPLVRTGNESRMLLNSETSAATFSLESNGVSLDRFNISVAVVGENETGQISCNWGCEFGLTLRKAVDNSTGHGGSRGSGYVLYSGKPDITPFFNFEGQTLWMIVGLKRQ